MTFLRPAPSIHHAPSPELFDQEVAETRICNLHSSNSVNILAPFIAIPTISTPPPLTYSTICIYGSTSSHHSSDLAQSDYLIPSVIEGYYSLNNELYATHDTIHSAVFSNAPLSIPPSNRSSL